MKCALIQSNAKVGDIAANASAIIAKAKEAAFSGAELCVTPELALVGYPPRDLLLYPAFVDEAEEAVLRIAAEISGLNIALILGSIGRNTSGKGKQLFNQALFIAGGNVKSRYSKRLLPTYDVFDETRYFEAGDRPCVVTHQGLRLALTVCEDIWNDSAFWANPNYAFDPLEGHPPFDLLINISASPFTVGKQKLRREMLAALAGKYFVPVVYVNAVGGNDDLIFDGRSMYVTGEGALAARAAGFKEDLLLVDVHAEAPAPEPAGSRILPSGACRMESRAESSIRSSGQSLRVTEDDFAPESEIWRALTLGLKDYCGKIGVNSVLLGLSGGIDSSLVAALACEALGRGRVHGLLLPSPYSSGGSLADAAKLAANLGLSTATLPIAPVMLAYEAVLQEAFRGCVQDVTEENLQARIRGNVLMAFSNKFGKLLLTTGNKSEISVGYCTIYGDMCGGLAVIGDLYKTEVFRVCRWLNHERGGIIPENVLLKPPSAELRPGQTDQDSLPPYAELDDILLAMLEERRSAAEIIAQGHAEETVLKVANLVRMAEFKRRQAAPVLKITSHAFGVGWRMPIACKQAYGL
ncbi:MAG: NAD+ synthase [Deltaproteobacteria bacterium]|nr:NAD+ synthase [Deltaproteobacteria bacterium]